MIVTLVRPESEDPKLWGTVVFMPKRPVAEVDQLGFEDRCFEFLAGRLPADAELSWGWADPTHFLVDVFGVFVVAGVSDPFVATF